MELDFFFVGLLFIIYFEKKVTVVIIITISGKVSAVRLLFFIGFNDLFVERRWALSIVEC